MELKIIKQMDDGSTFAETTGVISNMKYKEGTKADGSAWSNINFKLTSEGEFTFGTWWRPKLGQLVGADVIAVLEGKQITIKKVGKYSPRVKDSSSKTGQVYKNLDISGDMVVLEGYSPGAAQAVPGPMAGVTVPSRAYEELFVLEKTDEWIQRVSRFTPDADSVGPIVAAMLNMLGNGSLSVAVPVPVTEEPTEQEYVDDDVPV